MKTFAAKAEDIDRKWWIVDAKDQILGQLAVQVANALRGKNKPIFTPNVDSGDFVVVINADQVRLTGKKEQQKIYTRFSGYVGGQKSESPADVRAKHPERIVERAVKGMIPHNRLGSQIVKKLKVYAGSEHPHEAQQPQVLSIS